MTDGHYANAWDRRLKATNPRHLVISGVVSHMTGCHRKLTTVAREMMATTDVMLYLVRGHRKS
ncbi:hypothetical protein DPMN_150405 [Dreissena polymorpha]|uniref:Uncharacterized protein n=1 Tax=Dreissena polymorpha TaxID=45954 RepID=A0A9D4FHX6_DREPO|nr:hypothetical protein DPMN_150405 [Dreissena polymorpha]